MDGNNGASDPTGDHVLVCTSNCVLFCFTGNFSSFCAGAQSTPAAPGAWHHVALTYDGSGAGGVKIYVDGALQTMTNDGGSVNTTTNTDDLTIGIDVIADSGDYFHGKIDEARVYSRALSASEVASIYLTGKNAANVIGEANFTTNTTGLTQSSVNTPEGIAFDPVNNRLFLADSANDRVLVYSTSSVSNGMNASFVLGEPNFTTDNTATTSQSSTYRPNGVAYDSNFINRLFVADKSNNRVLLFNAKPISNGMTAGNVVGQANFTSGSANQGGSASQSSLSGDTYACYDPGTTLLFVSDTTNNRVLVFDATVGGGSPSQWPPGYE